MKNKYLRIPLALGLVLGGTTASIAQDEVHDGRFYVTGQFGIIKLDRERNIDPRIGSPRPFYGIGVGRFFTRNLSLDLELDRTTTRIDPRLMTNSFSRHMRLHGLGLHARYHFGSGKVRPYVVAGIGAQRYSHVFDEDEDLFGKLGVGIWSRLGDYVHNRIELAYRYDRNEDDLFADQRGFDDWTLSTYFNFMLGAPPRPPAPEPERAEPPPPPPPPPAPEPEPEPEVLFDWDASVFFEFDSAQLRPDARAELNRAAEDIRQDETLQRVELAGHTCDLGPEQYNQGLSERRAQAVYDYLVDQGVPPNLLTVRGYGEDRPKVPNTSSENRRENRRVETVVVDRSR